MFDFKKCISILFAALCMQAINAQEYEPKILIKNETRAVLEIPNVSLNEMSDLYPDLVSLWEPQPQVERLEKEQYRFLYNNGAWVREKYLSSIDLICHEGATIIFKLLPGKLLIGDTYLLSPEVYQKWQAGQVRLWAGVRLFWTEPDVKPIVSEEIFKKAVATKKDILVCVKREKWIKSVFKLRKPLRHYRISHVELIDRGDTGV
jgi:hypothetical protein